jgi:hypothetical protein
VTNRSLTVPLQLKDAAFYRPVSQMLAAFAGIFLLMGGVSPAQAQVVTVNPNEAPGPLTNPMMGFRDNTYQTVVQQYIPWREIENLESDSVQKIRDFSNAQWADFPAKNVKVIPRVYLRTLDLVRAGTPRKSAKSRGLIL